MKTGECLPLDRGGEGRLVEDVEGMEVGGLKVPDDELLQPGEDPAGGGEVVLDKDGE